jgi:hypothetical protein
MDRPAAIDPPSSPWSDRALDAARRRGDPPADDVVAAVFASGGIDRVNALMASLVASDDRVAGDVPPPVRDYLAATAAVDQRAPASVAAGEAVFAAHGPEILMILCCSSLPSAYAARRGVQVLYRTSYLARRPNRRLFETAQMIVDVMTPGGLGPSGRGLRTAQKVRLMHAAIRHLIRRDSHRPWDEAELGVPINQEDLLGTLMTFSWLVISGLDRLGVPLSAAEAQAYLDAWVFVGRLMGVEPALLPASVADARLVCDTIERRQVDPSPEGRAMTATLLGMMRENLPAMFAPLPDCMLRLFLPSGVADGLGVPSHPVDQLLLDAADRVLRPLEWLVDHEARRRVLVRAFSARLVQWMISVELGDRRARFALPARLSEGWAVTPASTEESFWAKLKEWHARAGQADA